MTISFKN